MKILLSLFLVLFSLTSFAQNPYQLYRAEEFIALPVGELEQLEKDLSEKLKRRGKDKEVLHALASVHCFLHKNEEALIIFDKLTELYPDVAMYFNDKAIVKAALGKYAEALTLMDTAIEIDKTIALFYLNRGVIKGMLKDYPGEQEDYNMSIKLAPNDHMGYFNRGEYFYRNGDYERAMEDINKSIVLKDDSPESYYNRGMIYYETGNLAKAMEDYNKALSIKYDLGIALMGRATVKYVTGDLSGAIADLTKGLQYGGDKARGYNLLSQIKLEQGDFQSALVNINLSLTADPNAVSYTDRGVIYSKLGNYPAALSDFEKSLQMDSLNSRTWVCLASSRYLAEDDLGCIEAANKALQISDTLTDAYIMRAHAKEASGQYQSAINDYTIALTVRPNDANLYQKRGTCYYQLTPPNYTLAIADLEKATQLDPAFAGAWYNLGMSYYNAQKHEMGCECFTKASQLGLSMATKAYERNCK